jgi:hypothetical protein
MAVMVLEHQMRALEKVDVVQDIERRSVGGHLAAVENDGAVLDVVDDVEVVGRGDHRPSLA